MVLSLLTSPLQGQALLDIFQQIFASFETDAEADGRVRNRHVILQPTLGTRASSPAKMAGEDARAPRQTAVITVSYIEVELESRDYELCIYIATFPASLPGSTTAVLPVFRTLRMKQTYIRRDSCQSKKTIK